MSKKRVVTHSACIYAAAAIVTAGCSPFLPNPAPVKKPAPRHHMPTVVKSLPPSSSNPINTGKPVKIMGVRKFPYPYDAMLAISSDADHETLRKFNLIHEFINTKQMTPFGYYGLGLDFSDSVFMYNGTNLQQTVDWHNESVAKDELSYFKGTSDQLYAGPIIDDYIHDGWIDTLHSYGDFNQENQLTTTFRRRLAKQAINALTEHGDVLSVWTDHGNESNVDDFGSYGFTPFYNYQLGANPWSMYYHTDYTIPYGIRYVWGDRDSSKFGMNSVIYPMRLDDGRTVWGFWRYTNSGYGPKGQVLWNWSVNDLDQQLSEAHLTALEKKHDFVIVAQHLEAENGKLPLPTNAIDALWRLANAYDKGFILVARTSRLLNYNVAEQYVNYEVTYANGYSYIHILGIADPVDGMMTPSISALRGITFYTTNPARTVLVIGEDRVSPALVQYNPSDGYLPSIGIKWFPSDTTNYAEAEPNIA